MNMYSMTLKDLYHGEIPWEMSYESVQVSRAAKIYNNYALEDYTLSDLLHMIKLNVGLEFLIPLALDEMSNNLFVKADAFPGDLLQAVCLAKDYWGKNPDNLKDLKKRLDHYKEILLNSQEAIDSST